MKRDGKEVLSVSGSSGVMAQAKHPPAVWEFLWVGLLRAFMREKGQMALMLVASLIPFGWVAPASAVTQSVLYNYADVDGIKIFYREAGDPHKPTILLLHGIPTSSQMYRDLIPRIAGHFHVIAPDFVGMGNSDAPPATLFTATQANLTKVMEKFIQQKVKLPAIFYMQDLGGPIGLRIATSHPQWVSGLVFQNTPISMAGWNAERVKPFLTHTGPVADEERLAQQQRDLLAADIYLYKTGARNPAHLNPDAWATDAYALSNPEKKRIMADYLADARLSFPLYPLWQGYLRQYEPKTLVVWGIADPIFDSAGVKDIQAAVPHAKVHFYNTGHFALEEDSDDIAREIITIFGR